MNSSVQNSKSYSNAGLSLVRIITGFFLIYHGWEIFSETKMNEYLGWDVFKNSAGKAIIYTGKVAELISGILLVIGLFTRLAAIIVFVTMAAIAFFVGHGKIWYEDQHPFLFVLLAMVFFFIGPGKFSADNLLMKK